MSKHTIEFWHKNGDKYLYMDKDGRVFDVKRNKPTVFATGSQEHKANMKVNKSFNFKGLIIANIIALMMLLASITLVFAKPTTYYTASPAYTELAPQDITYVDNMSSAWVELNSLRDVILTFQTQGPAVANLLYKRYLNLGDVIQVETGKYNVEYIETYNGFYLFKITELQKQ